MAKHSNPVARARGGYAPWACVDGYNETIDVGLDRTGPCQHRWCTVCRENPEKVSLDEALADCGWTAGKVA